MRGLRIAYVAFEPYPNSKGSGTRITQMVGALANAGASVRLITLASDGAHIELPQGVDHRQVLLAEHNYLSRALMFREGVARLLAEQRPDVVHVRGIFEGQAGMDYSRRNATPLVFEVNGLPSVELRYHYPQLDRAQGMVDKLAIMERRVLDAADVVITQSRTTRRFLHKHGLGDDTPTFVLPNGADPTSYLPPAEPTRRDAIELFYSGSLAPWQGLFELLAAVRRARRERDVRLRVAGPARRRWRRHLARWLRKLELTDHVELLGAVDRSQLPALVANSDVCLAPLRRDVRNTVQGCSPIKLFEYMSAARPIISTDIPCVREIVRDGKTGVLIGSSQPRRLAKAILDLADRPDRRERYGAAARQRVIDAATWSHRRQRLVEIYRDDVASARA